MPSLIRYAIIITLVFLAASGGLAILGVVYLWTQKSGLADLPYLNWLFGLTIAEGVTVALLVAKQGLKYLPNTQWTSRPEKTEEFMAEFIGSGSSVTIVSNRLGWLTSSSQLRMRLISIAKTGTAIEIISRTQLPEQLISQLGGAGVKFFITKEPLPPESRFTLVNGTRTGAERLAIARGSYPKHEITVFDAVSGPQIIAMAKDIIKKSKQLASA